MVRSGSELRKVIAAVAAAPSEISVIRPECMPNLSSRIAP